MLSWHIPLKHVSVSLAICNLVAALSLDKYGDSIIGLGSEGRGAFVGPRELHRLQRLCVHPRLWVSCTPKLHRIVVAIIFLTFHYIHILYVSMISSYCTLHQEESQKLTYLGRGEVARRYSRLISTRSIVGLGNILWLVRVGGLCKTCHLTSHVTMKTQLMFFWSVAVETTR